MSTPLRKAFKKAGVLEPRETARCSASKRDRENTMEQPNSTQFLCLRCDKITRLEDKGGNIGSMGCGRDAAEWLKSRFSHRSSTFCVECFGLVQTFINALSDVDAHTYLLRGVEAMVERDLISGEAVDSHGFLWPSIQERRGCRVVFHMDRTSKAAMTDGMLAVSDEERGQKIAKHFMKANLSTKSSSQGANVESQPEDGSEDDEEFDPASLNFESFQGIGPFKAQFAVYMLDRTTDSLTTSLRCTGFLQKRLVAEWGVGRTLQIICNRGDHASVENPCDFPLRQKDSSVIRNRFSLLCTCLVFYSPLGKAIRQRIVRGLVAKSDFCPFTLLHLEFLLCEMRKYLVVEDSRTKFYGQYKEDKVRFALRKSGRQMIDATW